MERSWTSADRVHAMVGTASSILADIRRRRRERLSDPRSALDGPALADGYDLLGPLARRLIDAYAEAAAALCDCSPATPASAARALAAAAAVAYAETIAEQLAR